MKKIYYLIIKALLCICLFLVMGIICKGDIRYKNYIYKKIYNEYLDFSFVNVFYDKYLGGIFPIENISNKGMLPVFNEDLIYHDIMSYEDGAMLFVDYNYLVPALNQGLVVYSGRKDKYGNVIIVEGDDGVDVWYGNMCNNMVKIYDRVNVGNYLGEVCDNKVYIVYTKGNVFLNYEEYLS